MTYRYQTHHQNQKKLPQKEFALLEYMCKNKEVYLSPDDIINALYEDKVISIATLRTYIKNMKRYISECVEIQNMKGVCYRFKIL